MRPAVGLLCRRGAQCSPISRHIRSSQITYCYTGRRVNAGATYPCRATRRHVVTPSTYEDKLYQTPTFAGAVRKLQTNELRNTVMLRLLRVNRLCSRTVSGTANRLKKHGRRNPLPFPFSQRSHVGNLRQTIQGKGVIHKRVETAGVYPLVRPRGVSATPR